MPISYKRWDDMQDSSDEETVVNPSKASAAPAHSVSAMVSAGTAADAATAATRSTRQADDEQAGAPVSPREQHDVTARSSAAAELLGSRVPVSQHKQQQAPLEAEGNVYAAPHHAPPPPPPQAAMAAEAVKAAAALRSTPVWTAGQARRIAPFQAHADCAMESSEWRGPKRWRPRLSGTQLEALRMMAEGA